MTRRSAGPRRAAVAFAVALVVASAAPPAPAAAAPPAVRVVHAETLRAGPYRVTVGFSRWPLAADRSLDILFVPEGGIGARHGTVTLVAPSGQERRQRLVRHPRARAAWGLDVIALPAEGRWTVRLDVAGPDGRGSGSVPVPVSARPGPPLLVGAIPTLLVSLLLVLAVAVAWRRARPARAAAARSW